MTYWYPQVSGGYRWNMLQRIYLAIGIEPTSSGDTGGQTFLTFSRELSVAEKASVDAIMSNNPTFPPVTTNTVFLVKDLWEFKADLEAAMGLNYDMYYYESVPGSGRIDMISLQFRSVLTTQQKNKVINEYQKIATWK